MKAANENLLVKFRSKNTEFGVTRETVKALARKLDVNETQVIYIALSKLANDVLPAYELDDGPLTEEFMEFLRKKAAESRPKGKLLSKVSLFDIDFDKIRKD